MEVCEEMECNKDEAQRAKVIAKRKFKARDLQGARKFALKAQTLFPGLEGIDQMIATFDIYLASAAGDKDWYSILSVPMNADDENIKKQYEKLAIQFHPDKNKSVGAEGAFRMVQEAYMVLSDRTKRAVYDHKRNVRISQQRTLQSSKASMVPGASNDFYNFAANATTASKPTVSKQTVGSATHALDAPPPAPSTTTSTPVAQPNTFWTLCNKCKMNYEYLRMYLNQKLRCRSCRELFLAKEVQRPPIGNMVQDSNISGANQNATTNRNLDGGPISRAVGVASATASSVAAVAQAANVVHQTYEKVRRERENVQAAVRREEALRRKYNPLKRHGSMSENANLGAVAATSRKKTRTMAKDAEIGSSSIISGLGANFFRVPGGDGGPNWKPRPLIHLSLAKTFSQMDLRGLLLEKVKTELKNKLTVIKNKTSQVVASEKVSKKVVVKENGGDNEALAPEDPITNKDAHDDPEEIGSNTSTNTGNEDDGRLSFNVPDPDFCDFDKNRTEECFRSDQIWASYDEDGMPRYYAFIQKVLSLKPFKLRISYLTSRTNSEFGTLNWVSSGFIKTCGDFRIDKYESCDIVNMFSHQMKWEKGLRGIIKIYPQKGDIWAIYQNWSPDWDKDTPDNVLHAYNVIEILDAYDEEHGISIIPLIKVTGFQTIFQRHQDPNTTMKIPKEEMFRFSHQVPFYRMSGEEAPNVPKDSYELDPAAIPKELLEGITETVEANGTSTVD